MRQTHWCSLPLPVCAETVETIWQQMCLSLDSVLFNICWCLKEIRPTWKNPNLAPSWKAGLGDPNRASPYGRWPVALLLTQLKQPQNPAWLLYTCTLDLFQLAAQLVWRTGKAKNMHLGTDIVSDAHARLHTKNNMKDGGCQIHIWPETPRSPRRKSV